MPGKKTDSILPTIVSTFLAGIVCGGILVSALIPDGALVTQGMALSALEKRCESGKVWEYRTPNPNTTEALLVVQCNPSS